MTSLLPRGDVVVLPGGNLDIQASEIVMLRDGFSARYGSVLTAKADPDLYYECNSESGTPDMLKPEEKSQEVIINKEMIATLKATIFPNPASDRIGIQLSQARTKAITIEVYNVFSELLLYKYIPAGDHTELNISQLNKGPYIARISDGEQYKTCKFIKL